MRSVLEENGQVSMVLEIGCFHGIGAFEVHLSFLAEIGQKGLQASTVQIVDKPGTRIPKAEEHMIEPPLGWGE
jgi:hypothetical protein